MPAKRAPVRRTTTARRRKPAARKHPARRVKIPRRGPLHVRMATWLVLRVVVPMVDDRRSVMQSRKDAAIERLSHEGCATCGGQGQIAIRGKNGEFQGSRSCTAAPTKRKVSRLAVQREARFGVNKRANLVGCSCPCGWKQKPRFRDAKEATKVLRGHEKQKHGGKGVGGTWYAQTTDAAAQPAKQDPAVPSKVVTDSGMTDEQWIKQNKKMHPGKAIAAGKCWMCAGNGKLHGSFGGQQTLTVCPECKGSGKPAVAATK